MSLNYTVAKPKDLTKINVNDFGELLWWSYYLNISPEKIVTTIETFGNSVELIKKNL